MKSLGRLYIEKFIRRMNFIIFYFDGKTVTIDRNKMKEHESRGDSTIKILHKMIDKKPDFFKGKGGIICFDDYIYPISSFWLHSLKFATTTNTKKPAKLLPFPCPYFDGWPEVGVPSNDELISYFETHAKDHPGNTVTNKIFWIGANTHPSRAKLKMLAEQHPDMFDVTIMEWNRKDPTNLKSTTRYVSLKDHAQYKYLIDCPGGGYSARLKWLLASGRPVFVVDREWVEPWHHLLKPMVHYIPVKEDLSDLVAKYEMIEKDPALYESISKNAKQFAKDYLYLDKQIDWVLSELERS